MTKAMARARQDSGERGVTLIELVVAMLIFAMVAIMGLQSLSGMLRQRDRAAEFASEAEALGRAMGFLRGDLSAAMPVLFYPPGARRPESAMAERADRKGFALTTGAVQGYAPLGAGGPTRRVEYRFDAQGQRLMRRVWGTAWPASAAVRSPEIVVMEGVTGLRLRSFWVGRGWVDGLRNVLAEVGEPREVTGQDGEEVGPESYSSTLPQAVEVTLVTQSFGEIVLMETPS